MPKSNLTAISHGAASDGARSVEEQLRLEARRESHLELIGPQAIIEAEARAEAWAEAEMIAAAAEAREAALQAHGRAGLRTREELARGGE